MVSGTTQLPQYFLANRKEVIAFLRRAGHFHTALDIGCAGGELGRALQQGGIVQHCDGIEPNVEAAQQARDKLQRVWQGGLESVAGEVPWTHYDLVVMADVLEHFVDPWAVLEMLHRNTAPGCRLMLSVPNVRHYKVLLPLLFKGEFNYQDAGIMDRTHLHFFTRSSLLQMLAACGWKASTVDAHMKSRYRRWYCPTRLVEPFVAVQYLLIAEKA